MLLRTLVSLPVVSFCTTAFAGYARYTTISVMLMQIEYLQFFRMFFTEHYFVYAFLSIFGLTLLGMVFCGGAKDKPQTHEEIRRQLTRGRR